jgi:diguanylate cyclase (GGDEF)-like protein
MKRGQMLKKIKLLVVEDDYLTQEQMKLLLEDEVEELYQAYDAESGFEIYKSKKPDIILTDITLPGINGLDMSEKIKKIDPNIKIIVISAYDDKEYLLRAINEIKVDYYLVKPLDVELLMERLEELSLKVIDKNNNLDIAFIDSLTNIYNRRYFEEKLNELIDQKKDFTIFFLDLDDFKPINDKYGHLVGDEVLKIFVKKVKNVIKETDFFARIGGDEFVLLIENINKKEGEIIANKILNALKNDFVIDHNLINVGCSIGIKKYKNETFKELLKLVDFSLYHVKKNKKGEYWFYSD